MEQSDVIISVITEYNPSYLEAVNRLIPQLNPDLPLLSEGDVKEILQQKNIHIITAISNGSIVGTIICNIFKTLDGTRATLEQIVVDESARGRGIGSMLIQKAIEIAKDNKVRYIDLTSRPIRVEANKLYLSQGFEKRDTNVYRYKIS